MSQVTIRADEAAHYFCPESPFATAGTPVRVYPVGDVDLDLKVAQVSTNDASTELYEEQPDQDGEKSGSDKVTFQCKPPVTTLDKDATGTALDTPPSYLVAKAMLGGEVVHAGSLVESAPTPTTTTFSVTATQGARFTVGQTVMVETSNGMEWSIISAIATDAITLAIALTAAPATGAKVLNMFNWYLDPANVTSFALRHALAGDSAHQYQARGCFGEMEFAFEQNQLLRYIATAQCATWDDGALGYSTAYGVDPQGKRSYIFNNAQFLLQAPGTSTRTFYSVEKISIKLTIGMEHIPQVAGDGSSTDNKAGVQRVKGRRFAEWEFMARRDRQLHTWQAAKTDLRAVLAVPLGSGASAMWGVIHTPRIQLTDRPKEGATDNRAIETFKAKTLINATASTALAKSPLVLAVGR
jgi:hypothetical protein